MPFTLPATPPTPRRWGRLTPLRIAGIYAVVAVTWIYTSDHLVEAIVRGDSQAATQLQTIKGAFYVALTAWMLYLLIARAERAVRREADVSQAVLAQLPEAVAVRDLQGRMAYINPAGAAMLGRPAPEIIGRSPAELTSPEIAERVLVDDARALATRAPVFSEVTTGHGEHLKIFRTTRIALHDDEGTPLGLIALTRDVTHLVREEEQLRLREAGLAQREKLEALGRLAGGVAHDFNNLLTVIGTAAELAADSLATGDAGTESARADLDEVRRAAQRAGDLTRRLLAFARHHPATNDRVEVDTVAAEMVTLVRRTLRAGVNVTVERGARPCVVEGSATALGQVVLNLVLNAADALPQGGVIVVGVGAVEEPGDDGGAARWVSLRVSDQGVGMDAPTRARALEPFFTTKAQGLGTGLGLATADAIVRDHRGRMRLESTPGEGTTVTVLLPAAAAQDDEPEPRRTSGPGSVRVSDAPTLLLVEDEAAVRALARRALQRAGFAVVEARHGADALRLVDGGAAPRVVVTDVAMPEMNGVQLAERLRARDPSLPVLFISGYTAGESLPAVSLGPGHSAFLQKPFSTEALVKAVVGLIEASTVKR